MDLKSIREAKQMTQSQVAEKVGIARESYTNIENGVRPLRGRCAKNRRRVGVSLGDAI